MYIRGAAAHRPPPWMIEHGVHAVLPEEPQQRQRGKRANRTGRCRPDGRSQRQQKPVDDLAPECVLIEKSLERHFRRDRLIRRRPRRAPEPKDVARRR